MDYLEGYVFMENCTKEDQKTEKIVELLTKYNVHV